MNGATTEEEYAPKRRGGYASLERPPRINRLKTTRESGVFAFRRTMRESHVVEGAHEWCNHGRQECKNQKVGTRLGATPLGRPSVETPTFSEFGRCCRVPFELPPQDKPLPRNTYGSGCGFILKGFPLILHFVLRLSVEGRSPGSKDTLKGLS